MRVGPSFALRFSPTRMVLQKLFWRPALNPTATPNTATSRPRGRPRKNPAHQAPAAKKSTAADVGASAALPAELTEFDRLPDVAYVRLPVVRMLFGGISPASVWRAVNEGRIPRPAKLTTQCTAWNVGALRETLAKLGGGYP